MRLTAIVFASLFIASAADARTWRIRADAAAETNLQSAFAQARPGDTVQLERGRFLLSHGLTLAVDRVSVRGEGADRSVLDFSAQSDNGGGVLVTSNRTELRDFAVENSRGDAITARDCNGVTFRAVRAEWTGEPSPRNGGQGITAINCDNVLIQDVVARGASGAGVVVNQSRNAIVRESTFERNVAGIVVENTFNADVFANTATHNSAGMVVADAPNAHQQGNHSIRLFDNQIEANDSVNFAPEGSPARIISPGTGVLILASHDVAVFNNEIAEHGSANVIVMAFPGAIPDASFNALPRNVMIRDNRFGRSGFAPAGVLADLNGVAMPDVLWDGADTYFAGGAPRSEPVRLVVRDNRAEGGGQGRFLSLGISVAGAPFSEGAPSAEFPPLLNLPEPERVRLAD